MDPAGADRVLLIQLKRVGDVLLATPLARALREHRAERRIVFLTEEHNRQVLRGNPRIDRVLTIPPAMGPADWFRLRRRIRAERPDLVVDLSGTPRSCMIAAMSGARFRLGFRVRAPRRWVYNRVVIPDRGKYTVDRRLDLLRSIGIRDRGLDAELVLDDADRTEADRVLAAAGFDSGRPILAIAPTSRKAAKRWSPEGFARVADTWREQHGAQILMIRGPGEEGQEEVVRGALRAPAPRIPEAPPLRVLAAMIGRSRAMVTNDGGPKHLAVTMGVPTVTLFVSTERSSWHPPATGRHVALDVSNDHEETVRAAIAALRSVWTGE